MAIPMTDRHRDILRKSTPALLKDLDADDVLPKLLEIGIITEQHVDKIKSNATRKDKVEALLEIIPRRGDDAYSAFLQALAETEHLHKVVKSFEDEQDSTSSEPTRQENEALMTPMDPQARGRHMQSTGNTFSQTINASGDATIKENNMTGQINNYHL